MNHMGFRGIKRPTFKKTIYYTSAMYKMSLLCSDNMKIVIKDVKARKSRVAIRAFLLDERYGEGVVRAARGFACVTQL